MMMKSLIGGAAVLASVTFANLPVGDATQSFQNDVATWLAASIELPTALPLNCGTTMPDVTSCNLSWRHFLN